MIAFIFPGRARLRALSCLPPASMSHVRRAFCKHPILPAPPSNRFCARNRASFLPFQAFIERGAASVPSISLATRRSVPFRAVPCHVWEGSLHVRRVSTVLLCARGSTHLPPSIPRRLLRRSRSRCASFALETLRGACTNNRRGRLFVTYVRTYPPPSQTLPNDLPCPLALTSAPPFSQDPRTGDQEGRWTDTRRRTPRWRGSNDHTARCSCFNRRERKEARENEPVGSLLDARAMNVPCRDGCSRAIFNHAWDTSEGQTLRWTIEG